MNNSKKLALVLICGLVLLVSAGCGSKAKDNQDHSNMSNMDHSNMKMDDKSNK